ncbi:glycoside hydrolase family 16 protein [Pseudonocardia sp. K10HN5]|uniref:Glycoside hydrolase family 16 protein n=1 Tax=Pseudonocardia acidicola TaxID=2724939 RepID=A0ABX1SLD2_9PSEU|nr:glycoside hydrolase family 16 protein [Pseudonocardia acidicola]NMI01222.1 glycoside hydrolase family 16 protein [Pseudonocardia acidicola]
MSAGYDTSAAKIHNWGKPDRVDEFNGTSLDDSWAVYDGPGHAGNGRRTPSAVSVADGILTITGDSRGDTAGMAWNPGQKYGRWEGRVKAPASDPSYNALLLLWPDAENFPVGGEIDFMEMMDHTRQETNIFLHYGPDNSQVNGKVKIDATQWHNWAVEWTPTHVAAFVDGKEWWRTTDTSILPPGPMHLCIQLDWFPKGGKVKQSEMQVDWVKEYKLKPADLAEGANQDIQQEVHGRADAEAIRQEVTDTAPAAPAGAEPRGLVPHPVRAPGN